jgi:hypothetical protein
MTLPKTTVDRAWHLLKEVNPSIKNIFVTEYFKEKYNLDGLFLKPCL